MTEEGPPPAVSWRPSTPGGGWVPVPDPTVLTTEQLRRELAGLRELLELQIGALKELALARFSAAEEAVGAALAAAEKAVGKAEAASEKRFDDVAAFRTQQAELTSGFLTRREYESAHQSVIDATGELRRQLGELSAQIVPRLETDAWRGAMTEKFEGSTQRLSDSINALSSRIDQGEGKASGATGQRDESRLNLASIVSIGLLVVAVITFVLLYAVKK